MKTVYRFTLGFMLFAFVLAFIPVADLGAQQYVKSDFRVSDASAFNYQAVQLSVSNNGDMAAVWETSGSGDIWLKTISSKGELLSSQIAVDAPNSTSETRVAHNDIGNFMVIFGAYSGKWVIMGQTYSPSADPIGDTLRVDRNTTEMIDVFKSSLQSNSNSQFAAFLPGTDSTIVEMFSENGEFLSNTIVLKPETQNIYQMFGHMTYTGDLLLVWLETSQGDFWGRLYTGDGTPKGSPFQISQKNPDGRVKDAALCSDTSGNFAVVWTNTENSRLDIYSQLFTKEGVAIGVNTRVTGDEANYLGYPRSIDMDLDGNFIVAWSDYRDNDTSFIYMQQMDKSGDPVGGNYRATTINNGGPSQFSSLPSQAHPAVRILRDTIYLAWINLNTNESNTQEVYASILEWKEPDHTGLDQKGSLQEAFSIYPNPSKGRFYLQWDTDMTGRVDLRIYNSSGMLIHQETENLTGKELEMNVTDLPDGLYYLNIDGVSVHSSVSLIIKK